MDGRLPSLGWSSTIPRTRMVTQHPRDGHLSALGWSPIIQNHPPKYWPKLPKDGHPWSQAWSPHHPKLLKSDKSLQLQLNKEFDTSVVQLVYTVVASKSNKGLVAVKVILEWSPSPPLQYVLCCQVDNQGIKQAYSQGDWNPWGFIMQIKYWVALHITNCTTMFCRVKCLKFINNCKAQTQLYFQLKPESCFINILLPPSNPDKHFFHSKRRGSRANNSELSMISSAPSCPKEFRKK